MTIFASLGKKPVIEYIDTPVDIRDKYQYFTEAAMNKLHKAGYVISFYPLKKGEDDYVKNYLLQKYYY